MEYRLATVGDIDAIAALHADSWRRNYRGAYLDSFLDGEVVAERRATWSDRLVREDPGQCTIIASLSDGLVGFAHTILSADEDWGALLDNLHVTHDLKGRGIGSCLMAESARVLLQRAPSSGLYLWVLGQNRAAQAFYAARGGTCVGRRMAGPFPGGGTAPAFRYAWPDPSILLRDD